MIDQNDDTADPITWPEWAQALLARLPFLVDRARAAELLEVTERTVDRLRLRGELGGVRSRGRVRIPAESLVWLLVRHGGVYGVSV